jgi:hypothetical protein
LKMQGCRIRYLNEKIACYCWRTEASCC